MSDHHIPTDPQLDPHAGYIGRVRTGRGGFVNPVDETAVIEAADILVKLPDGPWFARYRPNAEAPEVAEGEPEGEPETQGAANSDSPSSTQPPDEQTPPTE